ncbi:MAG: SDR family NAD(P)-dependent oxidoreductase [Pseudomonadota bacterium]|nr:SDR family NAD(P)-dependent oxidoreductase [Pseudomonadota bacterium]
MKTETRPLAIVTGASSGIGLELAILCAQNGYDLLAAADRPMDELKLAGESASVVVETLQLDLAIRTDVEILLAALRGRTPEILIANAGHGLGRAFLDQDTDDAQHVVDTNISGTIFLLHRVGNLMRAARNGRILITGSIAGFMPGAFQAVYNGTKAFIDSFSWALRNELKESGVTVTCLMPGVTDTQFFERADLLDTAMGASHHKMDPVEVARLGFQAMMDGEGAVVTGTRNKLQTAMASLTPAAVLAERHRRMAAPGTANK